LNRVFPYFYFVFKRLNYLLIVDIHRNSINLDFITNLFSEKRDLNSRPFAPKANALPSYAIFGFYNNKL
jgi:hypothetical protein